MNTMADSDIHKKLYYASWAGEDTRVKKLLAAGAEPDKYKLTDDNTALAWAAFHGRDSAVSILILHGAKINRKNKYGWTALHWAAYRGHNAVLSILLLAGADPYLPNNAGKTPIQVADNEKIARLE